MVTILESKSLYYNDVNIVSDSLGQVIHRQDIPKELWRIIVSPMDAVVGQIFAMEAASLGLTVVLHRFCAPERQLKIYKSIYNKENIYCAIGLEEDLTRLDLLIKAGCDKFCIDIALGTHPLLPHKIDKITKTYPNHIKSLMLGNVHHKTGIEYCYNLGTQAKVNHIITRVGIGNGIGCSSSDMVGVNRGPITEIIECNHFAQFQIKPKISVCADGSLRKPGYFCKAFAAGADYCMAGGYWMQTKEAESNFHGDGSFWGGASHKQQIKVYGRKKIHSEGKEIEKLYDKKHLRYLSEVVDELWFAIASYVSYSGHKTLSSAIGNGTFEIKQNSLPPKERY